MMPGVETEWGELTEGMQAVDELLRKFVRSEEYLKEKRYWYKFTLLHSDEKPIEKQCAEYLMFVQKILSGTIHPVAKLYAAAPLLTISTDAALKQSPPKIGEYKTRLLATLFNKTKIQSQERQAFEDLVQNAKTFIEALQNKAEIIKTYVEKGYTVEV